MARTVRPRGVFVLFAASMLVAACGGGADDELLVFAASSLTESFNEIERAFEAANPDIDVIVNYAGSSALREQVLSGAPADILATANHNDVFSIEEAGLLVGTPELFATNQLQIAVPAGNPGGIRGLDDFGDPSLRIGLCAEPVPCGDAAEFMLSLANVEAQPDTREPNVKSLTAKLVDGELDAGLVYETDLAAAAGALDLVAVPAELRSRPVVYAVMNLSADETTSMADAFVSFVLSAQGQEILTDRGFGGAR